MAGTINKTIRLPDDKVMRKFVETQSSFTKAITYLVVKYCKERGYDHIEDLSVVFENYQFSQLYGLSNAHSNNVEDNPEKNSYNTPKSCKSPAKTMSAPAEASRERMVARPHTDIPSCYQ